VAFPVEAMVMYWITLVELAPPLKIPLVDDEHPETAFKTESRSPKSVALPVVAIVT